MVYMWTTTCKCSHLNPIFWTHFSRHFIISDHIPIVQIGYIQSTVCVCVYIQYISYKQHMYKQQTTHVQANTSKTLCNLLEHIYIGTITYRTLWKNILLNDDEMNDGKKRKTFFSLHTGKHTCEKKNNQNNVHQFLKLTAGVLNLV